LVHQLKISNLPDPLAVEPDEVAAVGASAEVAAVGSAAVVGASAAAAVGWAALLLDDAFEDALEDALEDAFDDSLDVLGAVEPQAASSMARIAKGANNLSQRWAYNIDYLCLSRTA
jgi:hypothetical protein